MCGIAGFLDLKRRFGNQDAAELASTMADRATHRGPDDAGRWADAEAGIAFGHRRLSIVDLSEAGAQPMRSASGLSVICYNGEVYNPEALRSDLLGRGTRLRGHSDTELLLETFESYGVIPTVKRVNGMFALGWWDTRCRTLWLVRDRIGKKPLYYGMFNGTLLFGSQLKSLLAHPACGRAIDLHAVSAYLRFGYFPSTHSVFQNIRQLKPGTALEIRTDGLKAAEPIEHVYWNALELAASEPAVPRDGDPRIQLEELLLDATGRRMVADVPLGAFLSGGIDSSLIVALMQEQSSRPVKTFTIGFEDPSFDEAPYAKSIAAHLGTDHTELYVAPTAALDLVPNLAEWYDEPFADSSQVPTLLVSQLARRHVTIALSGDGGDELFQGYPWYRFGTCISRLHSGLPPMSRDFIARVLTSPPHAFWNALAHCLPASAGPDRLRERAEKLAGWMKLNSHDLLFREIRSVWSNPNPLVPGASEPLDPIWAGAAATKISDFRDRMPLIDLLTFLPDDILTKLDRATMAVSLEGRCPILDHRVVEFALTLPRIYKASGRKTKMILRDILARRVPRALFERQKHGFESPIANWLRGPLRDWAEDLLDPASMQADGLLNPAPIRERWAEHLSGRRDWQNALWNVLMLQQWKRRWA